MNPDADAMMNCGRADNELLRRSHSLAPRISPRQCIHLGRSVRKGGLRFHSVVRIRPARRGGSARALFE